MRAASATPEYDRLLAAARRLHERGRHYESARAAAHIEELAATRPLTTEQTMHLGVLRALLALDSVGFGLVEEHCRGVVENAAQESDRRSPAYADAGMLLGRVLARTGRVREAIGIMESALEFCPGGHDARGDGIRFELLRQLGQVYGSLDQHHDAVEVLHPAFLMALEVDDLPRELLWDVAHRLLKAAERSGYVAVYRRVAHECLVHVAKNGIREHDWYDIHQMMGHMAEVLPEDELDSLKTWFSHAEEAYERDCDDDDSAQSRVAGSLERFRVCHERLRQIEPGEWCESDLVELEEALADAWHLLEGADLLTVLRAATTAACLAGHGKRVHPMLRRAYARLDRLVGAQPVDTTGATRLFGGAMGIAQLAAELGDLDSVRVFRHAMADRCIAEVAARGAAGNYRRLADACVELGDFEEALTELTHCEEVYWLQRDDPERLWCRVAVTRARALTGLARLEEAEEQWRHVMEGVKADDGHYPDAYESMLCAEYAECVYLQGREREAVEILGSSRAWRANPSADVSQQAREHERLTAQIVRARIAALMRVPDAPSALRATIDELEEVWPYRVPEVRAEWARAMLGDDARVHEAFREAVRALRGQRNMRHGNHPLVIRARAVMREAAARSRGVTHGA